MSLLKRTPNPDEPWGLIFKEEFGVLKVIRAHCANIPWLVRDYGWTVLITDNDVTIDLPLGQEWKKPEGKPLVARPFFPPQNEDYR